jgi:hypothetical protein
MVMNSTQIKSCFWLLFCIVISCLYCSCLPKEKEFIIQSGEANFSNTIVIGGTWFSGYQNGGINKRAKDYSLSALLFNEIKKVGANNLIQAEIEDEKGIGLNFKSWEYLYHTQSELGNRTDCKGVVSMGPVKEKANDNAISLLAKYYSNANAIVVPFATTEQWTNPNFAQNENAMGSIFYKRIAKTGANANMLGDAVFQNPSFFISWPGMEDIFNYAAQGGVGFSAPDASVFEKRVDTIFTALTKNGAKGVIATIPDFKLFPFFNLIKWDNADISQAQADSLNDIYEVSGLTHISFKKGRNGFVIADNNANGGVRQMQDGELITLSVPLDSMKCYKYGLIVNLVNNKYVLDKYEIALLENSIASYNLILRKKAAQYNLAIADIYSFINKLPNSIKYNGADINNDFVTGGFFSLDGLHPHEKGYALIANEFIKAINQKYNSTLPTVNCKECQGVLFP